MVLSQEDHDSEASVGYIMRTSFKKAKELKPNQKERKER